MAGNMYAIVCSEKASQLWPVALAKLEQKYEERWPGRVHTIRTTSEFVPRQELADLRPHFCCFLAHHSECSKDFIQQINRITRQLDTSHPYTDTIWGVLTGLFEDDILSALDHEPLSIGRVVANCSVDLEKFGAGVWYSEFDKGISYCKSFSFQKSLPTKEVCPDDTTELIVQEISEERQQDVNSAEKGVDMIISSGHATQNDWNIAHRFSGGKFLCNRGQLYGSMLTGKRIDVHRSKSPKILSAAGNCLMGHIANEHSMALGWMHSANVVQMVGYIEPTWFGYGGWGVHKYFINNPGSMTFAEAFFANQQSLLRELHSKYGRHMETMLEDHQSIYDKCFDTSSSAQSGISRECSGLLYDRDNVVFYGDPAWRAQLETNLDVYDFTSSLEEVPPPSAHLPAEREAWHYWRFTLKTLREGKWSCPIPDDKDTCPGRPPVCVFPQRLVSPRVLEGEAIVTERFLLLPLSGDCLPGEHHSVLFKSKKASH